MYSTLSRQRTMPNTCSTRRRRISSASSRGAAVMLQIRGTTGGAMGVSARASAMTSAAGAMSGQWNGALTGNMMLRLAPRSAAISTARSTASREPLITTCPGALSLAAVHTPPASSATARASATSNPSSAAIAPSPTGTASCMARPRIFTSRAASARAKVPAAASAEYSPSECPATNRQALAMSTLPSSVRTRRAARLTAMSAGWAFSVRVSSSSGPSNMRRARFCLSTSSTSSKTRRAGANASARSRPMPTAWAAWPGNTNARAMESPASPHGPCRRKE